MTWVQSESQPQPPYPVYPVHEKNNGHAIRPSRSFKLGDPLFRSDGYLLKPSPHRIEFQAYTHTDEKKLVIESAYESLHDQLDGDIVFLFDPDNSRRKPHNAFAIRIRDNGQTAYEAYRYELEASQLPPDVVYARRTEDGMHYVRLELPYALLRIDSPAAGRIIGFNMIRTITGERDPVYLTWSGVKGEKINTGQGTGSLLLTKGLSAEEIQTWTEQIGKDSELYFTKWQKRNIPAEIYEYTTIKQRGFTVRINADDAKNALHNAEHTDWGRAMKREIVNIADYWAAKSDEELFDLVPVGNPRALSVSQFFGDPLAGGKRLAFEVCLEKPYQFYNPATGTWWYNGMAFRNPTTGEEYVLDDDGSGFVAPEGMPNPGVRYMFTASYRLFILSMLTGNPYCGVLEDRNVCPVTTGRRNAGAIPNLAYAYLLTGDRKYAYKALILAGRMAELVPYMNGNYGSGYYDTVQISEPTTTESHWLSNYFDALDLIYDAIDEVEPELQALFAAKPDAEGRERTEPFSVKRAVHDMIPDVLFSCEIEKTRGADWSLRWIYLELIVASFMQGGKLMQHILYEGKYSLRSKMLNNFFRDGRYMYDSLNYINLISDQVAMMANNNYRFKDENYFPGGVNMFEDPQFGLSQVIKLHAKLKSGNLTPMFGDAQIDNAEPISDDRKKGKLAYSAAYEIVFRRLEAMRPTLGSVLAEYDKEEIVEYRVRAVRETNQKHAFLLLATAADWSEYQQYKQENNRIQPSFVLEDSEISVLRAGSNHRNCKHVFLYGQPSAGHMHGDKLGLWIGAYGYHLLAGAGDYPYTWVSPKYPAWEVHAAACTVVVIDGQDQQVSYSRHKCHYEGERLQLAGMDNRTAYPGSVLERWSWLVTAPNGEDAYVLDLSYATNGGTFDYNTMGLDIPYGQVRFEGVAETDWTPLEGTMAGKDIALYSEPGYGWMKALRKAHVTQPVSWTFPHAGAALRIHTVPFGEKREIVCSLGERGGQEMGKSDWVPFVMWRDAADDQADHKACFVTVMEPYDQEVFLRSVRPLMFAKSICRSPFNPAGVEVEYADGRHKDILVSNYGVADQACFMDSAGREVETDAKALLLRYKDEQLIAAEAVGYTYIRTDGWASSRSHAQYKGTVTGRNLNDRTIEIELDRVYDEWPVELAGLVAYIDSPQYEKPSTYVMHEPKLAGNRLVFTSEMSLIKLEQDWPLPHKRRGLGDKEVVALNGTHVYVDVKPGDSFMLWNFMRETFV